MGRTAPVPTYECRILDRDLRVIRTFALASCETDEQAADAAADLFARHSGKNLAGFEIRKDHVRHLVRLMERPNDLEYPFEDAYG
jgi:hypothetical protein